MNPVTVLIPVGPQPEYLQWLPEAINSVLEQTVPVDEILLIDDGDNFHYTGGWEPWLFPEIAVLIGDLLELPMFVRHAGMPSLYTGKVSYGIYHYEPDITISCWKTPWNIGFAQAFNCGVGLADNDLIVYLAADDMLYPTAVEDCLATWEANDQKDAWYAMSYRLQDGTEGNIPINAAMITRNLWKWAGGFPPSAFAGPDALFLSRLMVHAPDRIIKVAEGKPNYWIRQHANQETGRQASFFLEEMGSIRNKETERFVPNAEIVLR